MPFKVNAKYIYVQNSLGIGDVFISIGMVVLIRVMVLGDLLKTYDHSSTLQCLSRMLGWIEASARPLIGPDCSTPLSLFLLSWSSLP